MSVAQVCPVVASKLCANPSCGIEFERPPGLCNAAWARRTMCSEFCARSKGGAAGKGKPAKRVADDSPPALPLAQLHRPNARQDRLLACEPASAQRLMGWR